jgi:hypothetical protein
MKWAARVLLYRAPLPDSEASARRSANSEGARYGGSVSFEQNVTDGCTALVVRSAVNALSLALGRFSIRAVDFHSMPPVHPTRLNVNSVCGRFPRFDD